VGHAKEIIQSVRVSAKMNASSEVREDSYIYKNTRSMTEHQNVLSGSSVYRDVIDLR